MPHAMDVRCTWKSKTDLILACPHSAFYFRILRDLWNFFRCTRCTNTNESFVQFSNHTLLHTHKPHLDAISSALKIPQTTKQQQQQPNARTSSREPRPRYGSLCCCFSFCKHSISFPFFLLRLLVYIVGEYQDQKHTDQFTRNGSSCASLCVFPAKNPGVQGCGEAATR